jgi:hypothetical protein
LHGSIEALRLRKASGRQLLDVGDQHVELALDHGDLVALTWVGGLRGRLNGGDVEARGQVLDCRQ